MRAIVILFFAVWLIIAVALMARRSGQESRGRREWRDWRCPDCAQPFGKDARLLEWRRKRDTRAYSALVNGPLVKCARCQGEFWFTWTGKLLPAESMKRSHEIAGLDRF
jgi:hypothetical protein